MPTRDSSSIASLNLFAEEEHRPFLWEGGRPAALFVHGFMGTPAEMRPLAREFHNSGWTAQGLLLPGFGRQIDTLFDRRHGEWVATTRSALVELREKHHPVVLVGYSMGGAVSLSVAAGDPPDGLVLLAPFWRLGDRIHRLIWRVVKQLFPNPQPFKRMDFSDPRFDAFVGGLLPDLDLGDTKVQDVLRQLRVPARFVDEIFGAGRAAEKAAAQAHAPTLIIQGTQDEAIRPAQTRQLLQRFAGPIHYQEIDADHGLVEANNPGFRQMASSVLSFSGTAPADVGRRSIT